MITVRTIEKKSGQNWMRAATHCIHGHEFNEANTYWNEEGWRSCRPCRNERRKDKRRKARENG
jgi:hypothetical protein